MKPFGDSKYEWQNYVDEMRNCINEYVEGANNDIQCVKEKAEGAIADYKRVISEARN